jgi:O-antigen/teichoic acid export membrane protein
MTIRQKLASNTTYLFLNWSSATVLSVIFWIILGKTLEPSAYGIVSVFFQAVTLFSGMSAFGLNSAINKLVPEFLERGRMDKVQGILSFSFKFVIAVSVVIAMMMVAFSGQLAPIMKLQNDVVIFMAVAVVIMAPTTLFDYVYYGFQNMKKQFLTNLAGGLSKVAFAIILIYMGAGYVGAVLALILSYGVTLLTRLEKRIFNLSKHPVFDRKNIIKFSVPAFIVFISSTILNESQYIMLSAMKTMEIAGLMSISMKIPSIIGVVPVIFFSALAPIVSGLSAVRHPKLRQSYLVKVVFRYTVFIIVPMSVFLIVFSKYVILLFATSEYLSATNILAVLTVAAAVHGICGFLSTNLYSIGRPRIFMIIQILSSAMYLFLSIPMTYYFSAMGMAVSYLLSNVALFAMSFFYLRKYLDFGLPHWDVARIAAGTVVSFALLELAMPYIHNFIVAAIASVLAGVVYIIVLLPTNFYIVEDLTVLDMLANRLPFLKRPIMFARGVLAAFVSRSYKETIFPAARQ